VEPAVCANKRPFFIVFEGIDGSGKSTQARLLTERFVASGIPCLLTAEPSDGEVGRKIRSSTTRLPPEEEARLFTEDRRDHLARVILPALAAGITVICDRYVYSSVAYQGVRGIKPSSIISQNREFARPADVTFLIEVPLDEALSRIRSGRGDSFSPFEVRSDLAQVDAMYRKLNDPLVRRIDGSRPPEDVHRAIVAILEQMQGRCLGILDADPAPLPGW
jgi:dTMP kinase